MTKARDLADFVSAGNPLADGTIDVADINGITATTAELNYTDGVTSNIQTQLDARLPLSGGTMTGNLNLGDSDKLQLGASQDIQLYHDGANSYLTGGLVGTFYVRGGNSGAGGGSLALTDASGGDLFLLGTDGGATALYYNGDATAKLSTTTTGVSVTGNITVSGTVDGRDIATDGTTLDGLPAAYQSYTDTAIANLVASAPATLDTLNELAAALGDDANFSTTVTNSIATKLALSGGTMTGDITFNSTQLFDGRDVSADGTKLDGIEAGATADQTITAGSGLTGGGTGDVTLSHADTSSQASVNNSGNTFIQDVTLDTYGHVTGLASATVTSANNATITLSAGTGLSGGGSFTTNQSGAATITFNTDLNELSTSTTDGDGDYFVVVDTAGAQRKLTKGNINISGFNNNSGYVTSSGVTSVATGGGLTGGTITGTGTISHADTSSQASVNNSGNTFIQDITLDTYGHVTGLTSATASASIPTSFNAVGTYALKFNTVTVTTGSTIAGSNLFHRNVYSNFVLSASNAETYNSGTWRNMGQNHYEKSAGNPSPLGFYVRIS